jgi:hypothetical protein
MASESAPTEPKSTLCVVDQGKRSSELRNMSLPFWFAFVTHRPSSRNSSFASKAAPETKTEGKKAPADAPPANLGWDSHSAVVRHQH